MSCLVTLKYNQFLQTLDKNIILSFDIYFMSRMSIPCNVSLLTNHRFYSMWKGSNAYPCYCSWEPQALPWRCALSRTRYVLLGSTMYFVHIYRRDEWGHISNSMICVIGVQFIVTAYCQPLRIPSVELGCLIPVRYTT